jgi:hypothetical protein
MRILKKIGKIILLLILFVVTFFVLSSVITNWRYKDFGKVPVSKDAIPEQFPILVLTNDSGGAKYHAETLYYKNLESYLAKHPNYTFLVPPAEEKQLNSELEQNSRVSKQPLDFSFDSPDPWQAGFKVTRVSDTRQALEVDRTWDDDRVNTSWYEATSKEIFPKYYQFYFAPSIIFPAMAIAFPTTCVLWALGLAAYFLVWRKKKQL